MSAAPRVPIPSSGGGLRKGPPGVSYAGKPIDETHPLRFDWRKRKAPKQVDAPVARQATEEEEGLYYNIWYGKFCGFRAKKEKDRVAAETRCNVLRDAGRTRGDTREGSFFCVHFARGQCCRGYECLYKHHLPNEDDELKLANIHDIFGRERHAADREDMGGVGTFNRENRTLYIGGIKNLYKVSLAETLLDQFGEWGQIEELKVFAERGFAFVRYVYRVGAEFGKEAMTNQSLGNDEVLNIKWATDDPNPVVVVREAQKKEDRVAAAIQASMASTVETGFNYPAQYDVPEPDLKRQKVDDLVHNPSSQTYLYPNTDAQYVQANPAAAPAPPPAPVGVAAPAAGSYYQPMMAGYVGADGQFYALPAAAAYMYAGYANYAYPGAASSSTTTTTTTTTASAAPGMEGETAWEADEDERYYHKPAGGKAPPAAAAHVAQAASAPALSSDDVSDALALLASYAEE